MDTARSDRPRPLLTGASAGRAAVRPCAFSRAAKTASAQAYWHDPLVLRLVEFFESKGLSALKEEDRREQWYDDWITFQARHRLYATLLVPRRLSSRGSAFDLLRYARFLEVFAYFSPAHGYSLQVTFLGLFAILMGANAALKQEAVAALEAGGLLAFGVSERQHGSDLLCSEFTVAGAGDGRFVANGNKYYIGNSEFAAIISVLARRDEPGSAESTRRAPLVLFALRPAVCEAFRSVRKIRTLGVRAAFVGEFEVRNHALAESDLIAQGRSAWDAVFGTVTLGKFFLGFGSIGICERAFGEAADHLRTRILYGRPVSDMPHIRATLVQAYARLAAMKLYAYRALDYVHAAAPTERRYLLFSAVQKAKVSTEGVKVIALLSECIGAKGFEADTYFEMALRDIQLIPGLESSMHINLGHTLQFMPRYLARRPAEIASPGSLAAEEVVSQENAYLPQARAGALHTIAFPHFLAAYRPLLAIANVRKFAMAAKAFELLIRDRGVTPAARGDTPAAQALGQCVAIIAYAQLIAEAAVRLDVTAPLVAAIFDTLVHDFSVAALTLASCRGFARIRPSLLGRMVTVSAISDAEADFVAQEMGALGSATGESG